MKAKWLLFPLCVFFALTACKKDKNQPPATIGTIASNVTSLSVANVLQSNMVVQRNKPFKIWGWAPYKTAINVTVSWNGTAFPVTATRSGDWNITVPASPANATPQTITITAGNYHTIKLTNILIGDVWVCAGQSNMVYQVDSISPFRGVLDFQDEIVAANYPAIRTLTVQSDFETSPSDSLNKPASWQVCSPTTVGDVSGVAYYFAQKLNTTLNVPIGIIVSAVNGTSCEAWISSGGFNLTPAIMGYKSINNGTQLYNGMISPFTSLSVSGFIWYQGENNRYNVPAEYTALNSTLITDWRTDFNQGQLPFYLVQMPPFAVDYFSTTPMGGNMLADDYAKFREAQANVLAVPGSGMAVTMDVGEAANQHPRDKKSVGQRLALLALKNNYGQNVQCNGPKYQSFTTNGRTATISFVPGTADGLNVIAGTGAVRQYFFVAGTDQTFVQAYAEIQGNQIVLTAPSSVPLPIQAIRYAFTNAPVTNLQNSASLPAEPFRTDDWSN